MIKTLDELEKLNQTELKSLWREFFENSPPAHRSALIRPIAYKIQEKQFGGLKQRYRTRLNRYVKDIEMHVKKMKTKKYNLKEGTLLEKTYQNRRYEVKVLKGGFLYNNTVYKSLSKIAKEITEKSWNGYRFFGIIKEPSSLNSV